MDFSLRINLLTIWLLIVARIATGQDHNCVLRFDDNSIVANDEWDTSIDLTSRMDDDLSDVYEVNKDFFTFKTENIKSARVYASDSSVSKYDKYFSVTLDGQNQLHLSTSSEYSKIEEVLTTLNVGFSVSFECATGTKITSFQVRIKDSNNNSPTFSQTQYDFKDVPMPLAVNINLLPMLYQINVLDVDITSQGVDMSLDPTGAEYFSASAVRTGTSKEYSVTLKIIKKLELSEPMTFKLIATDRGTASDQKQVTSEVTVTLEPNVEESVYEPKFVEPLYTAKITESKGVIKFNEGDIKLQGLGQGKVQFVLSDPLGNFDYSSYITCEATSDSVQCSWNEDEHFGELLEQPYALIKLMGKQENYNEDYTIIHLSLPGPPPTTTTTSTTITETPYPPCTTETTTICPECPSTVTVTECDCTTASVTFDPTTMCPTSTDNGQSTTLSTGTTEGTTCPTFDPTTMCPSSTDSGDSGSSTTPSTGSTEACSCPSFDPTTMCPSSTDSGDSGSSTTPSTGSTEACSCPSFDPTTMCPSSTDSTDNGSSPTPSTGSTEACSCPSFDPTTMCPQVTSTDGNSCITECPTECPTTETTDSGSSISSHSTDSDSTTSTPQGSTICPECPATCPDGSTEWSSTSSTGTPEPLTKPEFSEREYEFTIYSPIKNIVLLEPKLKKEVKNVEFSITYGEETEVNWLDIDRKTGAVKLTNYPSVGEHNFQLKAVIPETELIDTVPLIIVVSSGQVCYNSTFVFQARYQRVKVPENKITTILPALETSETVSCTFTFETDIGSTEDYFIVNGTTGHTMVKSLDREADEFNNAAEPTIRLTVNATCGDDDEIQSRRSARGSGDYVGELPRLEFIDNQKSIMDIVVLIQDENDNPPVFNTKSVTVGYPTRELSEVLQPPSLATVQATDADIGENAVITYSLEAGEENNNRFWIHPTTGVIYPRQEDFDDDDDMKIKVSAKDKGGKAANPKLTVNVRPLKNDQVFEVVVAGAVLENVNSVVENISKTSGLDVRVLTSAVVPGTFSSKSRSRRATLRDESSPTALRLVLYALENDKPIELDDFKKKLGDNSEVWQVREIQTTNKGSHGEDTTGYLAAVITLAVLLVLILGGAGVAAYIFIIRPRMKKTADYDRFRQESKDGSESNLSSVVPTIPPLTEDILKKKYDADVSPVALNGSLTERQYENTSDHYETTDWATSHETLPRQPETPEWGSLEVSLPRQTETQSAVQTPADYLLAPPEIPPARKRSLTLYGDEDLDESGERRDDSSNDYDVPDENAVEKANRRKSVVTFNENVDTIEIERL
ncbi:uncharacterized protein [Anabrus simplex]|uniref:uncharacterized protein isoform X2 n=1 Tax=Anabrus simplex TaxID=316456 RepID=UPI0035A26BE0